METTEERIIPYKNKLRKCKCCGEYLPVEEFPQYGSKRSFTCNTCIIKQNKINLLKNLLISQVENS